MLVRNNLVAAGITAYSDYIPDETSYPFCKYEIITMESYPDWSFEKDYEKLTVKFNIYGNNDNPIDIVAIAEQIETIFDRTQNTFVDTSNGKYLVCNYKVDDSVTQEDDPKRWLAISEYDFVAQRNI